MTAAIEAKTNRIENTEIECLIDAENEASTLTLNCWRGQLEILYRKAIDEAWEEVTR